MRAAPGTDTRRLNLALFVACALFLPGMANAQPISSGPASDFQSFTQVGIPIFEQYDACTGGGPASQQFPDFGDSVLQAADDFYVSGTEILNQVVALGSFNLSGPMGPVTFEVYDIDGPGNLPGTLICSEVGIPNEGVGSEIDIVLDSSCALSGGTYWLSVYPVMSFADFGQWFWNSNESGYGSEFAFQDPDGLVGNPCSSWGLGITDCGVGAHYPNLCFGIGADADCNDGGCIILPPAVSVTGSIVLVIVMLISSYLVLRFRRRATER